MPEREPLVAGVDLGTSSVRCLLFDRSGRVRAAAAREYPTLAERPGWAELDPDQVLAATVGVLGDAVRRAGKAGEVGEVAAVGLSSCLFSVLAVDGAGRPLTRALTWMDNRAAAEAEALAATPEAHELYLRTGCRVHPMYPLSKLLWLKANAPDLWQSAPRFVSLKEYVIERLFGERVVDYSVASSTGYFNLERHDWDPMALTTAGLTPHQLSRPVDATYTVRGLSSSVARQVGLPPETPFALGAGDGMLAHLACGGFEASRYSSTIGTSGALRVAAARPLLDPQERTWCYCFDHDTWVAGGAINNGGLVLRWLRDRLGEEEKRLAAERGADPYEILCAEAAAVPPGADGLVVLPFLTGERSPHWNALASGVVFGLQLHHTKAHLTRAFLEAVAYRMRSVYDALHSLTGVEGEIWANGGYTRSPLWVQIQADVFGRPVVVPRVTEASAFGAALVAMKAVGLIGAYREMEPAIAVEQVYRPDPANESVYRAGYGLFCDLYRDVRHEFGRKP